MVDQFRYPRFNVEGGFADPLKRVLGFQAEPDEDNEYKQFFPGLMALRDNAVIMNNHRTASAACVPSRSALFSGQYGTVTGVLYTDGCLKSGLDEDYPWLDPKAFPTIGDWMRGAGYSTHYFGKWHVSSEATTDLEEYGFGDWELTYPDPYGVSPNNLGYYRDYQFSALTRTFLLNQGLGVPLIVGQAKDHAAGASAGSTGQVNNTLQSRVPWFAVCSLNNPHDIGLYSRLPSMVCDQSFSTADGKPAPYALRVPFTNTDAALPRSGTMKIKLNPKGFPQENATLPSTWREELVNKPDCLFEGTYKVAMSIMVNAGTMAAKKALANEANGEDEVLEAATKATLDADMWGMPLTLNSDQELASRAYLQYYGYLLHEVDQHIYAVLEALEETGQADDTIVIFTADHGENGASHHMMMEKFHNAYEETIHVPLVVRFPRSRLEVEGVTKQLDTVTSNIDLLPTILGLAGVGEDQRDSIMARLSRSHEKTYAPVGTDLSAHITAAARGEDARVTDRITNGERQGVLFMTHDTISKPLPGKPGAGGGNGVPNTGEILDAAVNELIARAGAGTAPAEAERLTPGAIKEPSLVHCAVSQDGWKLMRYLCSPDTPEDEKVEQYELYDLNTDPGEEHNLLVYDGTFPTVVEAIPARQSLSGEQILHKASEMMELLTALEHGMLEPRPQPRA